MLRLPKSDLFLSPPVTDDGSPASFEATLPGSPTEAPRKRKERISHASVQASPATKTSPTASGSVTLRFELARALPALWAKAQRDFADGRADREKEKLRELILWLLAKKCTDVRQRQSVIFQHEGKRTSGRVDVVAYSSSGPALAIEMDWAYARKSLEKLQAAQCKGWDVMWVCGAKMDKAAARSLRIRANTEFGPTFRWLYIFHLEHGWL